MLAAYGASATAALLEEARARSAHAILCHWALPCGPIAAAASAMLRVPFALVAHGSDVNQYAKTWPFACAARWAIAKARRVAAVSADLCRTMEASGLLRSGGQKISTRVIPMGVDATHFRLPENPVRARSEARKRLGIHESAALLLFVGDLTREKGALDLVEAISVLRRRGIAVEAAFAGAGELQPAIEGRAAELQLRILGRVSQADLGEWHRASDLLVLPSHSEGAPVSVMEALASGLPVVATRVGGLPEIVEDGVTGWLTPLRNSEALADQIERLLRDPASLELARKSLAKFPRDFSASRRAEEYRALLEEVVRGD